MSEAGGFRNGLYSTYTVLRSAHSGKHVGSSSKLFDERPKETVFLFVLFRILLLVWVLVGDLREFFVVSFVFLLVCGEMMEGFFSFSCHFCWSFFFCVRRGPTRRVVVVLGRKVSGSMRSRRLCEQRSATYRHHRYAISCFVDSSLRYIRFQTPIRTVDSSNVLAQVYGRLSSTSLHIVTKPRTLSSLTHSQNTQRREFSTRFERTLVATSGSSPRCGGSLPPQNQIRFA